MTISLSGLLHGVVSALMNYFVWVGLLWLFGYRVRIEKRKERDR